MLTYANAAHLVSVGDTLDQDWDDDGPGRAPSPASHPTLTRVGAYRLQRVVASGGQATVYAAAHVLSAIASRQGRVAVKVLHAHLSADRGAARRFELEAELGANLRHPALVPVLDFVADGCHRAMTLSWLDGHTLADERSLKGGRLTWEGLLPVALQVADAVAYLHSQGIVHRDISARNIFLARDGGVYLLDLGLAHVLGGPDVARASFVGTPAYAAPEAFGAADSLRPCADVHALAAVLLEALTGALPWTPSGRQTAAELASAFRRAVPDHARAAIHALVRSLDVRPDRRPADGHELAACLRSESPAATCLP